MTTTTTPGADAYTIPQEFQDFRDTIRDLVKGVVAPRAAEIDAKAEYPWDVRKAFADHDLLGLPFPEEFGGTGTGTLMLNMAVEEVAKGCCFARRSVFTRWFREWIGVTARAFRGQVRYR